MGKKRGFAPQALICRGGKCRKAGADELVAELARALEGRSAGVGITGCLGQCKKGVAALLWPEGACASKLQPKHAEKLAAHLLDGAGLPKKVDLSAGKKARKKAKKRVGSSAA